MTKQETPKKEIYSESETSRVVQESNPGEQSERAFQESIPGEQARTGRAIPLE